MPGAKPGERRGGRQKGTPNKAKAAESTNFADAMKIAAASLSRAELNAMSPSQTMRHFAQEAISAGYVQAGMAWMKDCAPYFDRRADGGEEGDAKVTINITGGLPDV